ncbi:MAG: GNAT family N-acetyltransferase [Caldilineaceae bacterium]|nr:GNAT family N-acetyltransferase [Caldilineaceae bacterium]MCB9148393.1 GNAT family N-acetyltransferase [Caldilineaceae bacterium]
MSSENEARDIQSLKLDMQAASLAIYPHFVAQAEEQGYRFSWLSALCNDPTLRPKLYTLVQEGVLSSPQSDGTFESFDDFCERLLQPYYLDVADSYIIATFETEWVGLSGIVVDRETHVGQSGLTVVQKPHQGKGVAKALKALSLARAAKQGATVVITGNHKENAPMLAINQLFGFVPHHS